MDISAIVNGEAEVTALGSLVVMFTIVFGIRPQGAGVLQALESDWRDNENDWTAVSNTLHDRFDQWPILRYSTGRKRTCPDPSTTGLLVLALVPIFLGLRHRVRI